jgi:hypothetical protein
MEMTTPANRTLLKAAVQPGISRREFVTSAAALAAGSFLFGCSSSGGSSGGSSGSTTLPSQPVPSGPITPATVSIANTQAGNIPQRFIGLSYEKDKLSEPLFSGSNSDLIGLFQTLGPGLLRIGGNSVDETVWVANGPGQTAGQVAPSDVNALAAFLSAVGWPVLYGVNLGGAGLNPPTTTPALAAAEVAYAVQAFGSNLFGIEIGNEPDLYAGKYFPSTWDFSDYLTLWQSFAAAILAQTPNAPLTGPVVAYNTSWFSSFAQAEGKSVVLLSAHYYRGNGQSSSSTIQELISYPDTNLEAYLAALEPAAASAGVPFRMAETNSFYNGGAPNISDAYASALWVIDDLFTLALGGAVGANFHGGGDSTGYTPIADDNGVVQEARPEYYGILFQALAGQGPLLATTIAAGSLNVSAYTVQNSPTQLSVIILNKDSTQNLQFTATCPSAVQSASMQVLTGPSLSAISGVTIQGAGVNVDGSFSPQLSYGVTVSGDTFTGYVPVTSAVLVKVTLV